MITLINRAPSINGCVPFSMSHMIHKISINLYKYTLFLRELQIKSLLFLQ